MEGKSKERRSTPRALLSRLVRIRPSDPRFPAEIGTTSNVSPTGLYFLTSAGHYSPGMQVYVTRDFQPGAPPNAEVPGAIVRVDRLDSGQCGVAIRVFAPQDSPAQ